TRNRAARGRKRDTGEPGNRGGMAAGQRSDALIEVSEAARPQTTRIPERIVNACNLYGMLGRHASRPADGTIRVHCRSRVITDEFEDAEIDPDVLCQQINQHLPDADAHIEDVGQDFQPWDDVVYNVSVTTESEDPGSIDRALFDHPLAFPWDSETAQ